MHEAPVHRSACEPIEVIVEKTPQDRLVVVVGPGVEHPLDGGGYDTRHQLPLRLIRKATLRPPQGGFLGRFDRGSLMLNTGRT